MKFRCNKKELSEVINSILPAVSAKSSIISLEGILIEFTEDKLTMTGYNLELGMVKTIPILRNSENENGSIILNAVLLANIINKMPEGNVLFEADEKLLTVIECQDVQFTILGINAEEYPDMPAISDDMEFTLPQQLLKSMISQTLFAVSQGDQNPVLNGSLFDIKNSVLKIVSVDGVRLAMRQEKIKIEEEFSFIVPGKTLGEIVKLLSRISASEEESEEEEKVSVRVSNKHICFCINGYIIISRLIEGQFLDYEAAIPKETQTSVFVETKSFLDSINRASIIINDRAKSPIRCTIEDGHINIFCESTIGKINDSLAAGIEGPEVKIGFNNKYMADALKASECDKLRLEINGPISPIKILPPEGEDFLFLVLPVRLKS